MLSRECDTRGLGTCGPMTRWLVQVAPPMNVARTGQSGPEVTSADEYSPWDAVSADECRAGATAAAEVSLTAA